MKIHPAQQSMLEKHNTAIRTVAAFAGIDLQDAVAEFEKRFQA